MTSPGDAPIRVGQQLARRREDLDLTQDALARHIGITVNSVSATERGRSAISRSKRPLWEQALRLRSGTISRAYRDGAEVEALEASEAQHPAEQEVYADLSNRLERAVWEMDLSIEDRKTMIDLLRQARAEGRQGRSA